MMEKSIETRGVQGFKFTNWATTYSCSPELYFEPESEDEIKEILALARSKGKKVKVVGYGHSPSDLACTTDYMISLKRLNKVVKVDQENLQVTVQGGTLICDLNTDILPAHDMAFSTQAAVSELTAAGVIATPVHGTGGKYGVFSSYVVEVTLMLATGEIIKVSKTENADLFPAVAMNLGCLGIILTVTFQCEKAFRLHQHQYPGTLKDVIENLDVHVSASDHFRFVWFPHTGSVLYYHCSRTNEKPKGKGSWFWGMFMGYHVFQFLLYISTFIPSIVPSINRFFYKFLYGFKTEKIDRSDKVFNFNCLFKQHVMEWSFPRNKTGVVLFELKEWIEQTGFPAHIPVEVRFVKKDDFYLSPCYDQDSTFINIIMYRPYNRPIDFETYWQKYQDILTKYGGRPHWAKAHKVTEDEFVKVYPKWQEFREIRQKLDPTGMFLNSYLERIFKISPATNSHVDHKV